MFLFILAFILGMFFGAFVLRKIQIYDEKLFNERLEIADAELRTRKSKTMKDFRREELK